MAESQYLESRPATLVNEAAGSLRKCKRTTSDSSPTNKTLATIISPHDHIIDQ